MFVLGQVAVGCDRPNSSPPPAAAQPVILSLAANDASGAAPPAGAPFFYTRVIKFSIPSRTVFEVAVEGWMLRENTLANCGDDGCYSVLSRNDDGTTTTYVIQVWPQAYKRFAHRAVFQVTNVSLNSGFTGAQLASKPESLVIIASAGSVLGGPPNPASTPGTPEYAAANEGATLEFRTNRQSNAQEAQAYYTAVGAVNPNDGRTTLTAWKQTNGFGPDDSQDDATAVYFNAGDLGLGRSMHMKVKPNGDVAYYVSNYPTVADAIRHTNLIATVAMEYTPGPQSQRIMKFFVYGSNDAIAPAADLDGNGAKFVPNLCVSCHGLNEYNGGSPDIGARFLPFDLRTFQYDPNQGRASQEAAFKQMNVAILQTNKSAAQEALLHAWYDDATQNPPNLLARQTQDDDGIPAGDWRDPQHRQLYLDVVRPACRSCHVSQNAGLDFGSFASFSSNGSRVYNEVCTNRSMPNAKVTYEQFWLRHLPPPTRNLVDVIKAAGVSGWTPTSRCPT